MTWLLIATRVVGTVEGTIGALLNLYLLFVVAASRSGVSNRDYKIAISISSVNGLSLCTIVSTMNYGHIFREGTFIAVPVGHLARFLPNSLHVLSIMAIMVLLIMMWTLIPATSALQLIHLSQRVQWSRPIKLLISYLFPCLCLGLIATAVGEMLPSPEFESVMIRISREVYGLNGTLIPFGSTMRYPEINYDRTLVYFAVIYAILPYTFTYAVLIILIYQIQKRLRIGGMALSKRTAKMQRSFFVMQLLQSGLPLLVLSSPFSVFLYGVFTQTDLGLSALWFTSFLWICPSVQAIVQLRYIRQASSKSQDTTRVSVSSHPLGTAQRKSITQISQR